MLSFSVPFDQCTAKENVPVVSLIYDNAVSAYAYHGPIASFAAYTVGFVVTRSPCSFQINTNDRDLSDRNI